jgi:hypothetical protein
MVYPRLAAQTQPTNQCRPRWGFGIIAASISLQLAHVAGGCLVLEFNDCSYNSTRTYKYAGHLCYDRRPHKYVDLFKCFSRASEFRQRLKVNRSFSVICCCKSGIADTPRQIGFCAYFAQPVNREICHQSCARDDIVCS